MPSPVATPGFVVCGNTCIKCNKLATCLTYLYWFQKHKVCISYKEFVTVAFKVSLTLCRKSTWPPPPVASIVTGATKRTICSHFWSRTSTPEQCGTPLTSPITRSTARWCSWKWMLGLLAAAASKALSISLPVTSAACTMRRWEWPPSERR